MSAKTRRDHAVELEDVAGNIIKPHTSLYNVLITCAVTLGSINYGYSSAVIAGALALPSFNELFLAVNTSPRVGAVLGIFLGGGFIGAILQQPISDRYGRRFGLGSGACFIIVGISLQAGAVNFPMFLVGRLIAGIGTAICITVSPITGYLLASLGSLGFSFMTAKIQWRINFIIALGVAILLLLLLIFVVPESPRWLVAQGRFDEAKRTLDRLHVNKHDPQGLVAKAELYQIKVQCAADKELPRGFIHIFRTPSLRKRAFCTILVWFGSMGTGVLVIANLTPLVFAGLGESSTVQLGLSAAWYAICIICSFAGGLAVDRFGRRNFLVIGCVGCLLSLTIEAAMQAKYIGTTNTSGLTAGVVFFFIFAIFYNAFYDAGSFVYTAEIWPTHLRGEGVTIAMCTLYAFAIAYNSPASLALSTIGWKYYLVFICVSVVSSICIQFYLPETAGLTLEEIGELFGETAQVHFRDIHLEQVQSEELGGESIVK
ncbi:major facilitator superfamily domain-containing protein [Exophiala viscosa]|uniref:major facilitator superfamily domain-containing protein n=1 Tax=Exophiala viscosa TaxID=2486360 RepID=UPI00218E04E3|nr:major facilitator superfamily domain-containing protein [Exophiala viscosa]